MYLLILGLALWAGAHFFKRLAPAVRAKMGGSGKALVAALSVLAIVLMVMGYRATDFVVIWEPPAGMRHLNYLLMVVAFYLFGVGAAKGTTAGWLRHPQLTAVIVWAVAHLLVNGDLSAIVLFGGLLVWAIAEVIVLNRTTTWVRPADVSIKGDAKALVIGLIVMSIAIAIHIWLGVNPFGG
tara:strand:- start:679 stop:1224 length:546 start_codon:yes stop_codon:yes gene_type:complete